MFSPAIRPIVAGDAITVNKPTNAEAAYIVNRLRKARLPRLRNAYAAQRNTAAAPYCSVVAPAMMQNMIAKGDNVPSLHSALLFQVSKASIPAIKTAGNT